MTKSNLETDIFNYKTPEFYINMKNIPDKTSQERKSFVLEEKRKCKEGININGIHIPGGLYFHLNYYHLQGDDLKTGKKAVFLPRLRDNEWIMFNDYDKCSNNKDLYVLFGARQIAKSEVETSLCLRELSLFKETEALALFSGQPDKDTFVKKISTAITHGEKFMIVPNIDKDWSKEEIRFGFTKTDNTTELRGRLYIYNTQEGKKIQVGSGKSVSFLLMDEIAKALRHGSKIYYKDRVDVIENVKIGDEIYGQDGKLTKVIGVYPQGQKQLYNIKLRDNRNVECCGDHLWEVYDRVSQTYKILNTEKLYSTYTSSQIDNRNKKIVKKQRYFIRKNNFVNYLKQEIKIDPYYLGLWLGDGTSANPLAITNIDKEVIEYIKKYSQNLGYDFISENEKHHLLHKPGKGQRTVLSEEFSRLNLIKNKHIPKEYLYNSYENRLELLKGLMDSDGTCYKTGIIEFSNCNLQLIENFEFLVRSLGINCARTSQIGKYKNKNKSVMECQKSYTVRLYTTLKVFKINRKLNNYKNSTNKKGLSYQEKTSIVSIEPTVIDYATCILVDNKDHLFLTNNFIVTHNSDFRGVYDTIEPALLSDMGTLRCAPILTFTGGETQKARDAKDIVENPKEQQFKTSLDDGNIIGGRFISGLYRKDCKEEKSISEYLGKETGTWIDNYPIHVSNFEKAFKKIDKEKEEALKSTDPNSFILKRIFFPLNLSDVFLTESNNKFPLEGIKQHQEWLKNHYEPVYAEFYRDINGKVSWRMSDKRPIHKFPVKPSDNKEAPVCIYEHPVQNAPRFTYVIGIDPLTNDESNDKIVSLFSLCVYKRMISPLDKFKNQLVASIAYRPKELKETHELALMLAEYYNALEGIYHEASESSLVQHFFLKKKAQYIADSFDLNSEISKGKFKGNSKKGSPPSTVNQRHYMDLMIEDANKEEIEINEDGDETYSLGVKYINDYMLLEEMKEYKGGSGRAVHGGNYDRIVSYGLALTLAKHYDVKYPIASQIVSRYNQNEKFKPSAIRAFGMMIETKENIFSFDPPKKSNIPSWMRGKS